MPSVNVVGGGLAGLAAAAALADSGFDVNVFESKPYLGGRATSYAVPTATGTTTLIDNCQHILLRCCVNLLDFYRRLGVAGEVDFHREFYFIEPGGRMSVFGAGRLPAPLHFAEAFARMQFLTLPEKIAVGRGILALMREAKRRPDLDSITMQAWLEEKGQPARAIERFWRQVLVSAINEELHVMAASHAFQVFSLGFLARSDSYEMGVPRLPLGRMVEPERWRSRSNVHLHLRTPVERLSGSNVHVDGQCFEADYAVLAVPWGRVGRLQSNISPSIPSSPITGIHLWFDRSVTDLPHATLLERTMQWMFNKGEGRHLMLLVSAARSTVSMSRADVVALAVRELAEFFPRVGEAKLLHSHVVKEVHATFSAAPGLQRPSSESGEPNVFLAGDWTRSGWPSTMEGAVRSGYLAAEAVTRAAGTAQRFLLPDIA